MPEPSACASSLVACPDCDLLQHLPQIPPGGSAHCARCHARLWRHKVDSLNRTLALAVAAAFLLLIANSVPMLGLSVADRGIVLQNGEVVMQGSAAELAASPEVRSAYLGL